MARKNFDDLDDTHRAEADIHRTIFKVKLTEYDEMAKFTNNEIVADETQQPTPDEPMPQCMY
jgi:hypothetical protein